MLDTCKDCLQQHLRIALGFSSVPCRLQDAIGDFASRLKANGHQLYDTPEGRLRAALNDPELQQLCKAHGDDSMEHFSAWFLPTAGSPPPSRNFKRGADVLKKKLSDQLSNLGNSVVGEHASACACEICGAYLCCCSVSLFVCCVAQF